MRWLPRCLVVAAVATAATAPGAAHATTAEVLSPSVERGRAKVDWTRIDVPPGDDAPRLTRLLRALLADAVKHADFGKVRMVTASVRVAELTSQREGGILRMSCTLVGRLEHGPRARSKISFGGDPSDARELEKQVLTMVANGLVNRLAELARARAAAAEAR